MPNDCLITKLKSVVSNDNLPILGKVKFNKVRNQDSFNTNLYVLLACTDGTVKAKLADNSMVFLDTSGNPLTNEITIPNYGVYSHLPLSPCKVIISDKYKLTKFETTFMFGYLPIDLQDFSCCLELNSIIGSMIGSLSVCRSLPKLKVFRQNDDGVLTTGSFKDFINCTLLEELFMYECNNIIGDIVDLGVNIALKKLTLVGLGYSGTIESFVAAQKAAGRVSVSSDNPIVCNFSGTNIKFNDASADTGSNVNLHWDENTITYNGTTISV